MTAALEGGEWSAARPGCALPTGKKWYPFYRRLGGPQGRSGWAENLSHTGIRFRTVQPVAHSLYRLSYPAHFRVSYYIYIYIYICMFLCVCFYVWYTGCFTTLGHNCRRWFPRSLWSKNSYKHVSDFGRLRSYDRFLIPAHALVWTASISWRVAIFGQLQTLVRYLGRAGKGGVLSATRAVHNLAAACVAAGSGIFENQL